MTAVTHSRSRSLDLSLLRGGRSYLWMALLALVLAVVSLSWPSTPSYDPYSWLIWGRQILHGHLWIAGGSSWKPLPVIFTVPFALFGSAQPDLWLIVARAGAGLTVLMSVKLTVRITWGLVSSSRVGELLREQSWPGRALAFAPVVLAGVAALICTTFTPSYPGNMLLGYSEGVMVAAFLIAVERAWDGHHRQAFALGIIPCLDRPEVWPIWGLYGLWLIWTDRRAWRLVVGLGVLMLALWAVPQKVGGGSLLSLATHAQTNRSKASAANASFPFWTELSGKLWPLVVERLEGAALLLMACTSYLLVRAHAQLGGWRAALHRYPAAVAASLCGLFGFLWWLGISVETQAGFAGNPRYAVIGVMFVCISGCAAFGWACIGLTSLAMRALQSMRRRAGREAEPRAGAWMGIAAVATALVFTVFAIVPDNFTHRMPSIGSIHYLQRYQAHLRNEVAALIQREGGPAKVMSCGSVMANNLQVTLVAWSLDQPIPHIQALPRGISDGPGPNVVFQDGATSALARDQGPTNQQMQLWEQGWKQKNGTQYKVIRMPAVTMYMDCSTYIQKVSLEKKP